jgi:hypothetical protein
LTARGGDVWIARRDGLGRVRGGALDRVSGGDCTGVVSAGREVWALCDGLLERRNGRRVHRADPAVTGPRVGLAGGARPVVGLADRLGVRDGDTLVSLPGSTAPTVDVVAEVDDWWAVDARGVVLDSQGGTIVTGIDGARAIARTAGRLCVGGATGRWCDGEKVDDEPVVALAGPWRGMADGRVCRDDRCAPVGREIRDLVADGDGAWVVTEAGATRLDGGLRVTRRVRVGGAWAIAIGRHVWIGVDDGLLRLGRGKVDLVGRGAVRRLAIAGEDVIAVRGGELLIVAGAEAGRRGPSGP